MRHKTEKPLEPTTLAQHAALQSMLDSLPAALFALDREQRYISFNRAHSQLMAQLGAAPPLPGGLFTGGFPPEVCVRLAACFEQALAGEHVADTIALAAQTIEVSCGPLAGPGGQVIGVSGACKAALGLPETEAAPLDHQQGQFRAAFVKATVGMALVSASGLFLAVNPALCALLGYSESELLGKHFNAISHATDHGLGANFLSEALAGRAESARFEKRYYRKDGSLIWVDVSSAAVFGEDGRFRYLVTSIQDVSLARQAQRLLENRFNTLFSSLPMIGFIYRLVDGQAGGVADMLVEEANEQALQFLRLPREKVVGRAVSRLFTRSVLDNYLRIISQVKQTGQPVTFQGYFNHRQRYLVTTAYLIAPDTCVTISMDTTASKQTERQLSDSESKLRAIIDTIPNLIWSSRPDGYIDYLNQSWLTSTGLTQEQARGSGWMSALHPDDAPLTARAWAEAVSAKKFYEVEQRLRVVDGAYRWYLTRAQPVLDGRGEVVKWYGSNTDITRLKQAEAEARASHAQLMKFASQVPGMLYQFKRRSDGSFCVPFSSDAIQDIFGCSPEEVREDFTPVARVILPEDMPKVEAAIHESAQALTPFSIEYRVQLPGQAVRWIWAKSIPERLPDGSVIWSGFNTDISERKQTEQALRENEELFRATFENATTGVSLVSMTGRFLQVNQRLCEILGYSRDELLQISFNDVTYPDDREISTQLFAEVIAGQRKQMRLEKRYIHKDGRLIWALVSSAVVRGPQGELRHMVAHTQDITERKRIEDQLRQHSRAVEQSPVSIVITNVNGEIEYVNPKFCALTGYTSEEAIGQNPRILSTGHTSRDEYQRMWESVLAGQTWTGEFRNRKKNGEHYWELASISAILNEKGEITHLLAVKEDISERKHDQQRILDALAFNQTILDTSPIGILIFDAAGTCVLANQSAALISGGSVDQLRGLNFHSLESWKTSGLFASAMSALRGQQPVPVQVHQLSIFGKEMWLNGSFSSFSMDGETHLLFMYSDDSERQKAIELLHQSNARLAELVSSLESRNQAADLLRQMSDMLQASSGVQEAYDVIAMFIPRIFASASGALFVTAASSPTVEAAFSWGQELSSEMVFDPGMCWALRRSRVFLANSTRSALKCQHVHKSFQGCYLEVPLVSSSETIGLLHLEWPEEPQQPVQEMAQIFADHVSLSLANIKLRETLRSQSVRDPLTRAFNRRYMEETLDRELPRARRRESQICLLMLDVDHFKNFNDTYGHAAGDLVLTRLSALLQAHVRGEDIVCRLGGEEFVLILPDTSCAVALERAESIRAAVQRLSVEYNGQFLGQLSVSIGAAAFPEHGATREEILSKADAALYQAKRNGRNRVEKA